MGQDNQYFEEEQRILAANTFAFRNGVRLLEVAKDHASVYMEITPDSLNYRETVHGGAYFTLADVCSSIVCRTDGKLYVTQQASVQYVRPAARGRLTAEGSVVHRGRTSCLTQVRITDSRSRLVFMGTFLHRSI